MMPISEIFEDMKTRPYKDVNKKQSIVYYLNKINSLITSKGELEKKLIKQEELLSNQTENYKNMSKFYHKIKSESIDERKKLLDAKSKITHLEENIESLQTQTNIKIKTLEEENEMLRNYIFELKKNELIEEATSKIISSKDEIVGKMVEDLYAVKKRKLDEL